RRGGPPSQRFVGEGLRLDPGIGGGRRASRDACTGDRGAAGQVSSERLSQRGVRGVGRTPQRGVRPTADAGTPAQSRQASSPSLSLSKTFASTTRSRTVESSDFG